MKATAAWLAAVALAPALVAAQGVSLHGVLGRKALLIVDGGAPRVIAPGERHGGVQLVSVEGDQAVVRVDGQQMRLRVGESPVRVAGTLPTGGDRVALTADSRGHFFTQGSINQRPVRFMVDTGATVVAIGRAEADRLGLKYDAGQRVGLRTAGGEAQGWLLKLASLRVGDVTVYEVDAVVTPSAMPAVLLGNSFLNRFNMQREGDRLMLTRR